MRELEDFKPCYRSIRAMTRSSVHLNFIEDLKSNLWTDYKNAVFLHFSWSMCSSNNNDKKHGTVWFRIIYSKGPQNVRLWMLPANGMKSINLPKVNPSPNQMTIILKLMFHYLKKKWIGKGTEKAVGERTSLYRRCNKIHLLW